MQQVARWASPYRAPPGQGAVLLHHGAITDELIQQLEEGSVSLVGVIENRDEHHHVSPVDGVIAINVRVARVENARTAC